MAAKRVSRKVSVVQERRGRDYELVLVLNPELVDKDVEAILNKVGQFITGNGGVIAEVKQWGKRKLAYPIRHFMEGNYVVSRFQLKPVACKEMEANLRVSEGVLRHLLVKLGD
ncbi:MAG: 30S ribosomal protein S6 [Chloroflexi bacterium]|nr:30S ribosomal protein S6 [Chloroflexota bacterium]